jgi:hypothetical protein
LFILVAASRRWPIGGFAWVSCGKNYVAWSLYDVVSIDSWYRFGWHLVWFLLCVYC